MFTASKLIALGALAITLANASPATVVQFTNPDNTNSLDLSGTNTDTSSIVDTANNVDQKGGPAPDATPGQAISNTNVTAVDGQLTNQTIPGTSRRDLSRRSPSRFARDVSSQFEQVFAGNAAGVPDASIEGTAYLTFTVVPNDTYADGLNTCLTECSNEPKCVFVNLFYEFNNPGLDQGSSNLKCAWYGDIHDASEKTNTGGQILAPSTVPTEIEQSSGWAAKSLDDPDTPLGYELVFGPTNGANNAPGYMGFAFLDRYDVLACAVLCNSRGADSNGGACAYFNIWRALVDGTPTTYTCSMYFVPSDASTAVNYGQGDLAVTWSRGYARISSLVDGDFESFNSCASGDVCFEESDANWIGSSPAGGHWDVLLFDYAPYAHTGHSVATFGSGDGSDADAGTLVPAQAITTISGQAYQIQGFYSTNFNGALETDASLQIQWNGNVVGTLNQQNVGYTYFSFDVTGTGSDNLLFTGGSFPSYVFLDSLELYIFY